MSTNTQELRDLVEQRIQIQWDAFAAKHPHLANAIDRVSLIETSVERLLDDPEYRQATDAAAQDKASLGVAGQAVDLIDRWVTRLLGI